MKEALELLKLAKSYLDEVEEKFDLLESGNEDIMYQLERLLDQAWEQIQIGEQSDPNVSLDAYNLNEAKVNYYYFKGYIEFSKKNYNGAISYLKLLLEIDPDFDIVYALISTCYMNIGNKEDAIKNIKHAIELKPEKKNIKKN